MSAQGGIAGLAAAGKKAGKAAQKAYLKQHGGLWREEQTKQGPVLVPLTNFTAAIVGELVRDDGVEITRQFEIEATIDGTPRRFIIAAAEFAGLAWISRELGARALVHPGFATRDHARFAIQVLSPEHAERRVFGHTGWRTIDGAPVYLHGGGGIDRTGLRADVETELGAELGRLELPTPGDLTASLALLELAPLTITAPLLAVIYRAALDASDITMHLNGPTGVYKSALAALAAQHYGPTVDARHLVGWHSTGNSLEALAFAAKDALFVIDDYAPGGAMADVQRMQREAARVIRAQGNRAGRNRLRPDGTLRPAKPPRCTILSTGEDVPGGQSIRARLFIVDMARGDIDLEQLTALQTLAAQGALAGALAAYVRRLATNLDSVRKRHRRLVAELRSEVRGSHARSNSTVAELGAALDLYLNLAHAADRWPACWRALLATGKIQEEYQRAEDPARRFVELIGALLSSGQAHLAAAEDPRQPPARKLAANAGWRRDPEFSTWRPQGPCVGWLDTHAVYLNPDAAYAAAQRLAVSQGGAIAVSPKALWSRLANAGLLVARDKDRNLTKAEIGEHRKRVVAMPVATILGIYTAV
jgi:hypothetical protein